MKIRRRPHKFLMILIGIAAIAGFSVITMLLWNWLLPSIFGLTTITFWQALGLLVLARLLFGGFGPRGMGGHHRGHAFGRNKRQMMNKWKNMTAEEREAFIRNHHKPFCHEGCNEQKEEE